MHPFDADTAVERVGDGLFEASVTDRWTVVMGPNGGFVTALVLRAMQETIAEAEEHGGDSPRRLERTPRSLTVHFAAPPQPGPVGIAVQIERAGRSLSTVSARLEQEGRVCALAVAAFSKSRQAPEFFDRQPPEVDPARMGDMPAREGPRPPFVENYSFRAAPDMAPADGRAVSGGWLRTAEPRALDSIALAAYTDAWLPAIFGRVEVLGVPTVDLTVHFREPLPVPTMTPEDHCFGRFWTTVSRDGFIEEDGEVWSPDGRLLAQSRQLAVHLA
jgi:acyl-CoA thioesterase